MNAPAPPPRVRLDRVRIDQELTFREAAKALGRKHDPQGRKLRNLVQARERQRGTPIAVRLGGEREAKVTLGALYRAFPEFRPVRVDYLAASLRELLLQVDQRTEDVVRRVLSDERLLERVQKLERRTNAAESFLRTIAETEANSPKPDRNGPTG